jgi:hypothetical protein
MAGDFALSSPNPGAEAESVRFIGRGLEQVAEYLDDAELQRCVAESASRADPSILKRRTRGGSPFDDCSRAR